jgi:hypothetical protein
MIKKLVLLSAFSTMFAVFTGTGILFAMDSLEDGRTTKPPVLGREDIGKEQDTITEPKSTDLTIICANNQKVIVPFASIERLKRKLTFFPGAFHFNLNNKKEIKLPKVTASDLQWILSRAKITAKLSSDVPPEFNKNEDELVNLYETVNYLQAPSSVRRSILRQLEKISPEHSYIDDWHQIWCLSIANFNKINKTTPLPKAQKGSLDWSSKKIESLDGLDAFADSTVTILNLSFNRLRGAINIGKILEAFPNLTSLNLNNNKIRRLILPKHGLPEGFDLTADYNKIEKAPERNAGGWAATLNLGNNPFLNDQKQIKKLESWKKPTLRESIRLLRTKLTDFEAFFEYSRGFFYSYVGLYCAVKTCHILFGPPDQIDKLPLPKQKVFASVFLAGLATSSIFFLGYGPIARLRWGTTTYPHLTFKPATVQTETEKESDTLG